MVAESLDKKKPKANNVFEQIILREFGGGCYGKCVEFCNLLKEYGIKTRIISGFLPYPEGFENGYFKTTITHFVVDVLIEDTWIEFDPSIKGIPTTFVRLSKLEKGLKLRKEIIVNQKMYTFYIGVLDPSCSQTLYFFSIFTNSFPAFSTSSEILSPILKFFP